MGLLVVVVVVVVAAAAVVICVYVRYLAPQYMAEYLNPLPCVYVSGRYLAYQYMADYINPRPCVYLSGRYLAYHSPLSFLQAGCPSCRPTNSVKALKVGCWRGYLSGARCRLAYGPADATATHCLLLQ